MPLDGGTMKPRAACPPAQRVRRRHPHDRLSLRQIPRPWFLGWCGRSDRTELCSQGSYRHSWWFGASQCWRQFAPRCRLGRCRNKRS